MYQELLPIYMVIALFGLLLLGYPVAFTLGGVAIIFGAIGLDWSYLNLLPLRVWGVMTNYTLLAVPLFIFMGVALERSGLAERLLINLSNLCARLRGGLAGAVVIAGALLAASTGIVGASVVTMGLISLPIMLKQNYPKPFSCGLICASGTLGQIIPPSIVLVLLGDIIGVSVGNLFIAALTPGLLLVVAYLVYVFILALRNKSFAARAVEAKFDATELMLSIIPVGILIFAVLGSIFFGVASPTEAAAVGAFGALFLALVYKKLNWKLLGQICKTTIMLNCMVFAILLGATAFGLVFRALDGDVLVTQFFTELPHSKFWFIAFAMLLIFILGCFLDFIEIVFIVVPILVPIMHELAINPLWFAVLIALNLQTSFLTPPLGFALFYLKGVAPEGITTRDIYKGVLPFVGIQLLVLLVVLVFPELVLWFI